MQNLSEQQGQESTQNQTDWDITAGQPIPEGDDATPNPVRGKLSQFAGSVKRRVRRGSSTVMIPTSASVETPVNAADDDRDNAQVASPSRLTKFKDAVKKKLNQDERKLLQLEKTVVKAIAVLNSSAAATDNVEALNKVREMALEEFGAVYQSLKVKLLTAVEDDELETVEALIVDTKRYDKAVKTIADTFNKASDEWIGKQDAFLYIEGESSTKFLYPEYFDLHKTEKQIHTTFGAKLFNAVLKDSCEQPTFEVLTMLLDSDIVPGYDYRETRLSHHPAQLPTHPSFCHYARSYDHFYDFVCHLAPEKAKAVLRVLFDSENSRRHLLSPANHTEWQQHTTSSTSVSYAQDMLMLAIANERFNDWAPTSGSEFNANALRPSFMSDPESLIVELMGQLCRCDKRRQKLTLVAAAGDDGAAQPTVDWLSWSYEVLNLSLLKQFSKYYLLPRGVREHATHKATVQSITGFQHLYHIGPRGDNNWLPAMERLITAHTAYFSHLELGANDIRSFSYDMIADNVREHFLGKTDLLEQIAALEAYVQAFAAYQRLHAMGTALVDVFDAYLDPAKSVGNAHRDVEVAIKSMKQAINSGLSVTNACYIKIEVVRRLNTVLHHLSAKSWFKTKEDTALIQEIAAIDRNALPRFINALQAKPPKEQPSWLPALTKLYLAAVSTSSAAPLVDDVDDAATKKSTSSASSTSSTQTPAAVKPPPVSAKPLPKPLPPLPGSKNPALEPQTSSESVLRMN